MSLEQVLLRPAGVAAQVDCAHCGLPVPAPLHVDGSCEQFCCNGCEAVHAAIVGNGLSAYYERREEAPARVGSQQESYEHFNTEEFTQQNVQSSSSGDGQETLSTQFVLPDIRCAACVWLLEKLPQVVPGVLDARVGYSEGRIALRWDPARTNAGEIACTLRSLGYPPHAVSDTESNALQRNADRRLLTKIGVAGAAFGNVMLLSFALYSADDLFATANESMAHGFSQFFRWTAFIISVPSVLWCGADFFRGALAALRTKTPHMDLPISIGISAALLWGSYSTLRGRGDIYFDTVTMLVFLLLVGRWLQARQQRAARTATDLLFAMAPATSRLVDGDVHRVIPTASIATGSLLEVRAGERVGVDGQVESGTSSVDEALLTGESRPRSVRAGAQVHAGTVNLTGVLTIRAQQTGSATRLSSIIQQVELAASRRPRIAVLADRASGFFTGIVLLLSTLTFLYWLPRSADLATTHAIAVLIVTCPCALGLSTPLAAAVALSRLAKEGILVKGMSYLEYLARPGLFVLDKTGTLTQGQLKLVHSTCDGELAAMIRAAEQGSAHPIARAIALAEQLGDENAPQWRLAEFVEHPGLGVSALLQGTVAGALPVRLLIGSSQFLTQHLKGATIDQQLESSLLERGLSPVHVAVDGTVRAMLGFGDPLRPEAEVCLKDLMIAGHELVVLSGDELALVKRLALELEAKARQPLFREVRGAQTPEQKLAYVESAARKGLVFMVGDGANDAAALSAASVGIAMSGGAEASLAAADAFSTRAGLLPLGELVQASRSTMAVIHRNLVLSLIYNLAAVVLAMSGNVTPIIAAILMPISSLTVVFSSLAQPNRAPATSKFWPWSARPASASLDLSKTKTVV